jgi:hypothetical protein
VPGTTHDYEIMRVEGVHQHKGEKLSKETTRTKLLNMYHQKKTDPNTATRMPWVIDPRTSRGIGYWDFIASLALIFTAFVTPFEVGFLSPVPPDERDSNVLFLVNRAIDIVFLSDMLLQFCLGYEEENIIERSGKRWVFNAREIVFHIQHRGGFCSTCSPSPPLFLTSPAAVAETTRLPTSLHSAHCVRFVSSSSYVSCAARACCCAGRSA